MHIDNNHCWTYCSLNSTTGHNIQPKRKGGFKDMFEKYKSIRKLPTAELSTSTVHVPDNSTANSLNNGKSVSTETVVQEVTSKSDVIAEKIDTTTTSNVLETVADVNDSTSKSLDEVETKDEINATDISVEISTSTNNETTIST